MNRKWIEDMVQLQTFTKNLQGKEAQAFLDIYVEHFADKYCEGNKKLAEKIAQLDIAYCEVFINRMINKEHTQIEQSRRRSIKGYVNFSSTELDVTDPCYDKNVKCRAKVKIEPGEWLYRVILGEVDFRSARVKELRITKAGVPIKGQIYGRVVSEDIGVDSGMCGFFEDKPDYTQEDNDAIFDLEEMHEDDWLPRVVVGRKDNAVKCNAIYCDSGYGDGTYFLREILDRNKQFCGYSIKFM